MKIQRKIIGTKVKCAQLIRHLMKDKRSLYALVVGKRFSRGHATRKELDDAIELAFAAHAANSDIATEAAYVALFGDIIDVIEVVASAARNDILRQCIDIIRQDYPKKGIFYKKISAHFNLATYDVKGIPR